MDIKQWENTAKVYGENCVVCGKPLIPNKFSNELEKKLLKHIEDLLSQSKSQIVEQILGEKKNHTPKSGAGRVLSYLLTRLGQQTDKGKGGSGDNQASSMRSCKTTPEAHLKEGNNRLSNRDVVYMCETILGYLDMGMVDRAKQHLENLQRWFVDLPPEGELLKIKNQK